MSRSCTKPRSTKKKRGTSGSGRPPLRDGPEGSVEKRSRPSKKQKPLQHREEAGDHTDAYNALYEFVHALECPLCARLMTKPSTFSTCGHTFCFECVIGTLEGVGIRWPGCPTCGQPGCRKDLKTNHLVGNAVGQVRRMMEDLARAQVGAQRKVEGACLDGEGRGTAAGGGSQEEEIVNSMEERFEVNMDGGREEGNCGAGRRAELETLGRCASSVSASPSFVPSPSPSLNPSPSPLQTEYGDLWRNVVEEDVRCIKAVLEVMDEMPVVAGPLDRGAQSPREIPSTERHIVVRQDSPNGDSVIPDSQGSELENVVVNKRVLQERASNVPSRSREDSLAHIGAEKKRVEEVAVVDAEGTARLENVRSNQVVRREKKTETVPIQPPPKTSMQKWWKGRGKHRPLRGDSEGMSIVVDKRLIAEDPGVMLLLEKFEARYGHMVTIEGEISKDTTHFVVKMDARSVTKLTVEYLEACAVGCWIVAQSWLEDSLQHGQDIVEEKYYTAQGHERNDGTTHMGLPENSRIRAIAGKRVFFGQSFVLAPGAHRSDQLMKLIEFAGGMLRGLDEMLTPSSQTEVTTQAVGSQASQKKVTCVVDSEKLRELSKEDEEKLLALKESGQVAVVNERWVYASMEKGRAQLRNDGFYVLK